MTAPATDPAPLSAAGSSAPRISTRAFTIAALVLCLVIACVVSIAASSHPDGLEYVAESTGFLDSTHESATAGSLLADYATVGIEQSWLSVAIAGAIGCVVTFGAAWLIGLATRRRSSGARAAE